MSEDTKTEELDLRQRADNVSPLRRACEQRVRVLPTDDYVAVSPYTPLSQAIEAMKNDEGGCVIVSMQPAVETLSPDATVGDAVRLMNEKSFRNIPLVKKGELVGSISVFDIITYLAESYPKETMNLPPLAQVMDTVDGG